MNPTSIGINITCRFSKCTFVSKTYFAVPPPSTLLSSLWAAKAHHYLVAGTALLATQNTPPHLAHAHKQRAALSLCSGCHIGGDTLTPGIDDPHTLGANVQPNMTYPRTAQVGESKKKKGIFKAGEKK